jgi:hypothetical protein
VPLLQTNTDVVASLFESALAASLIGELAFVEAPRRFGVLWQWRSECGRALRLSSGAVVLVNARVPRALRRCLVAVSPPFNPRRLPLWVRRLEHVELGVAADESPWHVVDGVRHPNPYAMARARFATASVARGCRARMSFDRVTESAGSLRELIRDRANAARFDVVFLADADILSDVVDVLGAAAFIAPREHVLSWAPKAAVLP